MNSIHNAVPSFCPASYAYGPLADRPNTFFLVTDFLDLGGRQPKGTGKSLAQKLAKLHTTPAPIPEGYDKPQFGFSVPTCCGSTVQPNDYNPSWASFYANNRLRSILHACQESNGHDSSFERLVETVASRVVPSLLGDDHLKGITPVVIHGDLWSGNYSKGIIAGAGGVEEVVYDPSCVYGHNEYELGIMKMFGGFGQGFWDEYAKLVPPSEPKEEFEDRVALYEL